LSVFDERAKLVAALVAVTTALGTIAPDTSFTVPEMRPTMLCALTLKLPHATNSSSPQALSKGETLAHDFLESRIFNHLQ
jgi:hypothetical protein